MNLKYLNLDYIITDEVSMVKAIFYNFLMMIQQLKPEIKFIIVGDFQLLPVVAGRIENANYKGSIVSNELCGGYRMKSSKCRRRRGLFKNCSN
jgi:hypothetical protein